MRVTVKQVAKFDVLALNIVSVRVVLEWRFADPLVVIARFVTRTASDAESCSRSVRINSGDDIEWLLSREVITDALATDRISGVGAGDVRWYPENDETLLLELSSPSGHAVFRVWRETLARFLADVAALEAELPPMDLGTWIPEPDDPAWEIDPAWGAL